MTRQSVSPVMSLAAPPTVVVEADATPATVRSRVAETSRPAMWGAQVSASPSGRPNQTPARPATNTSAPPGTVVTAIWRGMYWLRPSPVWGWGFWTGSDAVVVATCPHGVVGAVSSALYRLLLTAISLSLLRAQAPGQLCAP